MKELDSGIKCLIKLDELIREARTGPAPEFACTAGVSKRTLHYRLREMRHKLEGTGVTITYNTALKTYQYTGSGRLVVMFKWVSDEKEVEGGK
jgi:hypothetical protein